MPTTANRTPTVRRNPRAQTCPIPTGGSATLPGQVVTSLSELKPSESGKIAYIKPGTHSNLHQLISFGLQPGIVVTVHRASPTFCIKFENTELALDGEIADNIYVWKVENNS